MLHCRIIKDISFTMKQIRGKALSKYLKISYLSVHQHVWGFISHPVAALSIIISLCHVLVV